MIFHIHPVSTIIVEYIIDETTTVYTMHKIMHIFKIHKIFIEMLCNKFIAEQYKKYRINDFYTLLQKYTGKKGIKNYPCYNSFLAKINSNIDTFVFEELDGKQRHILYFLSIYYKYIWYTLDIEYEGYFGYELSNKIENGVEYSYKYLKGNRLYNPKYFKLAYNEHLNTHPVNINADTMFMLHDHITPYKQGISNTHKTLTFIRL